jgi:hypothetical protein
MLSWKECDPAVDKRGGRVVVVVWPAPGYAGRSDGRKVCGCVARVPGGAPSEPEVTVRDPELDRDVVPSYSGKGKEGASPEPRGAPGPNNSFFSVRKDSVGLSTDANANVSDPFVGTQSETFFVNEKCQYCIGRVLDDI